MHALQVGIALIQRIAARYSSSVRGSPPVCLRTWLRPTMIRKCSRRGTPRDRRSSRHVAIGAEIALLVLLAGREREAQPLVRLPAAAAARPPWRDRIAGREAVTVSARGSRPVASARTLCASPGVASAVPRRAISRNLSSRATSRSPRCSRGRLQPRARAGPQHHAVGRGQPDAIPSV